MYRRFGMLLPLRLYLYALSYQLAGALVSFGMRTRFFCCEPHVELPLGDLMKHVVEDVVMKNTE